MGKPEGIIEDYLGKLCKYNNFLYYKFTSPANAGVPDRIIIAKGQIVFVELKKPTGRPQKIQKAVIADMREHGAKVLIVYTKEQARKLIKRLGGKTVKRTYSPAPPGAMLGDYRIEHI